MRVEMPRDTGCLTTSATKLQFTSVSMKRDVLYSIVVKQTECSYRSNVSVLVQHLDFDVREYLILLTMKQVLVYIVADIQLKTHDNPF